MLRADVTGKKLWLLWGACAGVGALAAALVVLGNPGNMGICGACFLRDTAGALGLFSGAGPRIFRPELVGLILGAFALRLGQGRGHQLRWLHHVCNQTETEAVLRGEPAARQKPTAWAWFPTTMAAIRRAPS